MKQVAQVLFLLFVTDSHALAVSDSAGGLPPRLTLNQAWEQVKEKSLALKAHKEASEAVRSKSQALNVWDDPQIDLSLGSKKLPQDSSRIQTWGLRQRLPWGAEREIAKLAGQGEAKIEDLRLRDQEREQQALFVKSLFELKISEVEKEHAQERSLRLEGVRQFLKNTRSYTSSGQLERTLIELRLKELEQRKSLLENRIKVLNQFVSELGVNPRSVEISWISPALLEKIIETPAQESLTTKQWKELQSSLQEQSRVGYLKPQVDIFVSQSREIGGAGEVNETVGVGVTLPLYSSFYDRQGHLTKSASGAKYKVLQSAQADGILGFEIKSEGQSLLLRMKKLDKVELDSLEAATGGYLKSLKRGEITIMQFLDYEDRVHDQVERFYENQMSALSIGMRASSLSEDSLVTLVGGNK